jgi:hypothetical protein
MFFLNDKRNIALFRASQLIIEANPNPVQQTKLEQNSFLRTIYYGFKVGIQDFDKKAGAMSYLEMTSILRKCSNFDKRSIAETLSSAYHTTGKTPESMEVLMRIVFDSDIPRNYLTL